MDVGIRELKARLSEFLDRAADGEVITVTDRGRPKAILTPLPGADVVERGIAEGWIRPGDGKPPTQPTRHRSRRSSDHLLDEDRGG